MSPRDRSWHSLAAVSVLVFCQLILVVNGQTAAGDLKAMKEFLQTFSSTGSLPSDTSDFCSGSYKGIIACTSDGFITMIQLDAYDYGGSLTKSLGTLSKLQTLRLQGTGLQGDIPAELGNCVELQEIQLQSNPSLGPFPTGFFAKLTSLQVLVVGGKVASTFADDVFPLEIGSLTQLTRLDVGQSNLAGPVPAAIGKLTQLVNLTISYNLFDSFPDIFQVPLPSLKSLRANNNKGLTGPIPPSIGTQLPSLIELWLHVCNFTGTIPQTFSSLTYLQDLKLSDNWYLTGIPPSLTSAHIDLHTTLLVGPRPLFYEKASADELKNMHFCSTSGPCDPVTTALLEFLKGLNYPLKLVKASPPWLDSFSCASPWQYLTCDQASSTGHLQWISLPTFGLSGTISPYLANITTLTKIDLRGNSLSGSIPDLSGLQSLKELYLQNNNLSGAVPQGLTTISTLLTVNVSSNMLTSVPLFPATTNFISTNNPIGVLLAPSPQPVGPAAAPSSPSTPSTPPATVLSPPGTVPPAPVSTPSPGSGSGDNSTVSSPTGNNPTDASKQASSQKSVIAPVIGGVVGGVVLLLVVAAGVCCFCIMGGRKKQTSQVQSPGVYESFQGDEVESLKSEGSRASKKSYSSTRPTSNTVLTLASAGHKRGGSDVGSVMSLESAMDRNPLFLPPGPNQSFPLQAIQEATDNFSEANILGRGGFGTVYRGQFPDGMMIAVKRMEMMGLTARGQAEFDAEIMVLTRVRHRHLVALLGYCVSGSERLLIYEYMSQGPLSRHIFDHRRYNLTPLNWKTRMSIALDVARGIEYLHGLAQSSFIHRDLKPSNVLIDNDFRAKVADFGLVKLAPSGFSVETRLAGTFGYLAPEYAATGRVTTKSDVYSYGVMLMELITGRKALDERQSEDDMHLVTWFVPMIKDRAKLRKVVDITLEMDDTETWDAVCKVADLSAQCTLRDPHQRPQMDNCVGRLMPLVQAWEADRALDDDTGAIDPAIQASALRPWDRNGWDATDTFDPTTVFPAGPILSPGQDRSTSIHAEMGSTHGSIPSNHPALLQVNQLHERSSFSPPPTI